MIATSLRGGRDHRRRARGKEIVNGSLFRREHLRAPESRILSTRDGVVPPVADQGDVVPVRSKEQCAMNLAMREITADELDAVSGANAQDAGLFLLAALVGGVPGAVVAFVILKK